MSVPIKLDLWTLKFEFHNFHVSWSIIHFLFFNFVQPFKNVKAILSLWAIDCKPLLWAFGSHRKFSNTVGPARKDYIDSGLKEGFVRGKELRSGRLLMVKCGCSWKVATRVEVDFFSFFLCNLRLENYWDVWMHYIIWEALYYLIWNYSCF